MVTIVIACILSHAAEGRSVTKTAQLRQAKANYLAQLDSLKVTLAASDTLAEFSYSIRLQNAVTTEETKEAKAELKASLKNNKQSFKAGKKIQKQAYKAEKKRIKQLDD